MQLQRFSDGVRRVTHISEITGMEGDIVQHADDLRVRAHWHRPRWDGPRRNESTGLRPKFLDELRVTGVEIPADYFDPRKV